MRTSIRESGTLFPPGPRLTMASGRERPAGGWELWAWLFMRVSGVALLLLAVGHVLIMHLPDGGVDRIDFGFVAVRWANPLWRAWDWALLSLALLHGVNGLRVIVQDYVTVPVRRFLVNMGFYLLSFALFTLGTITVFTFDPTKWGPIG
ncbi:MAG: succinate dehydrogenase hydrophobic membrane anchor subunit [Actinomycetota bacterium]